LFITEILLTRVMYEMTEN